MAQQLLPNCALRVMLSIVLTSPSKEKFGARRFSIRTRFDQTSMHSAQDAPPDRRSVHSNVEVGSRNAGAPGDHLDLHAKRHRCRDHDRGARWPGGNRARRASLSPATSRVHHDTSPAIPTLIVNRAVLRSAVIRARAAIRTTVSRDARSCRPSMDRPRDRRRSR